MSDYGFNIMPLIWFVAGCVFAIWGCWELIDWLFIDEVIRSPMPIVPEIELVIKDNIIDTVYVYRKP